MDPHTGGAGLQTRMSKAPGAQNDLRILMKSAVKFSARFARRGLKRKVQRTKGPECSRARSPRTDNKPQTDIDDTVVREEPVAVGGATVVTIAVPRAPANDPPS